IACYHTHPRMNELAFIMPAASAPERLPNLRHRGIDIAEDQLIGHPHHPIPAPSQACIPPSIGLCPPAVIPAIDLDDELLGGRADIGDVSPNRHLPAKGDSEPAALEGLPQDELGECGRVAHGACALSKNGMAGMTHD